MCNSHDSAFPEYTFSNRLVKESRQGVANDWIEANIHDDSGELHLVEKLWLETGFESLLVMTHSMTDSVGAIMLSGHAALYTQENDPAEDEWV